jgi:site-specific DNA-methyltransferase (adenine-specific)
MKVEIGEATLILGDCREVMRQFGSVDVVISDPPYGEVTHKGARTRISNNGDICSPLITFGSITQAEFLDFCGRASIIARRWVVMTCEWQHAAKLLESGLPLVRLGVWVKPNGAPQFTGDRPGTGWEAVAILHREGKKYWNGGGHHAVWWVPKIEGDHPTQKPQRLINEWVRLFSDAGETILDPYMGSGTTGVACAKLGRKFIGIEINQEYFDIACKRIERAYREPNLFKPRPTALKQDTLFT